MRRAVKWKIAVQSRRESHRSLLSLRCCLFWGWFSWFASNAQPAAAHVTAGSPSLGAAPVRAQDWGSANASSAPQTRRLHTSLLRNVHTNLLPNLLLKSQFVFYPKLERLKITHEGSLSNKISSSVLPNTSATAVGLLKYLLFCPNPHTNKMLPYTTKIPKEIIMLWLRHFIGIWEIQDHSFLCRRCPLDPTQTTSRQFVPTTR